MGWLESWWVNDVLIDNDDDVEAMVMNMTGILGGVWFRWLYDIRLCTGLSLLT